MSSVLVESLHSWTAVTVETFPITLTPMILGYDVERVGYTIICYVITIHNGWMVTVSCDDGDLRLVGGETEYDGRLEVCISQRWGTVSGNGWSASDTQVACRQLGFDAVGELDIR